MKFLIFRGLFVVTLLVTLSGCPSSGISTGVWIFTTSTGSGTNQIGLNLENGGTTQTPSPLPPEANAGFAGTSTWAQNGSTFTLTQTTGAFLPTTWAPSNPAQASWMV